MKKGRGMVFLCCGPGLLLVSLAANRTGVPSCWFRALLTVAVGCRACFVVSVLRRGVGHIEAGHRLIFAGVALILTSLVLRYVFPAPTLRGILLRGAVAMKVTGVAVLLAGKRRTE